MHSDYLQEHNFIIVNMIDQYMKEASDYDRLDELKEYRKEFFSDNDSVIYMDGNSLGKLPLAARR